MPQGLELVVGTGNSVTPEMPESRQRSSSPSSRNRARVWDRWVGRRRARPRSLANGENLRLARRWCQERGTNMVGLLWSSGWQSIRNPWKNPPRRSPRARRANTRARPDEAAHAGQLIEGEAQPTPLGA